MAGRRAEPVSLQGAYEGAGREQTARTTRRITS